jgi:hypothetical protein
MSAAEQHTNPILDAARDYAARGWRCIPIKAGEKRPTFNDWVNVATVDPDRIANWWGHGDRYGVGIVTGAESGIWVLDVDIADGKAGMATLTALQDERGSLPATVTAITGSGGRHYFLRWDPDHPVGTNGGRLGPGLDVRGEGGQVVAAPTIHPNGTPYRWCTGLSPDDLDVADAPPWLLELLRPVEAPTIPTLAPVAAGPFGTDEHDDSPAAWFNDRTTWHMLLTRDGWTLTRTLSSGEQQWTRPGKEGRDGISATVGHQGRDVLKVFTSSVPGLDADQAYGRFGYEAAMHHHGNRSELARQIRTGHTTIGGETMPRRHDDLSWAQAAASTLPAPGPITGELVAPVEPQDPLASLHLVNWADFWDRDPADEQWVLWPLVPRGRSVSLYAPAKAGKSTVLLDAITTVLDGRGWLGGDRPDDTPVILYLDYEMTEDDLRERLELLGFDDGFAPAGFHYAVLPTIDPLDTIGGALEVVRYVDALQPDLVVLDTFGRAVAGDEDSADTVRSFYRHTGLALKARGVAVLRTDHTGKDADKGMRGSSAKADDVDVVWKLTRTDEGARLKRTHSRINWGPAELELIRRDHDGIIRYHAAEGAVRGYKPGTKDVAAALERIGHPIATSRRKATAALKDAGEPTHRADVIGDAVRWRKNEAERLDRDLSELVPQESGTTREPLVIHREGADDGNHGNHFAKEQVTGPEPLREPLGTTFGVQPGTTPHPFKGAGSRDHLDETANEHRDNTANELMTDDPYADLF